MQTIVTSIFVFGLLILVHELGHYFVARWTNIKVLELAIGFGPKLISWRKNETDYSLRVFPLGGFCRLLGENPDEMSDLDSLTQKPALSRAAVLFAGAAMNFFLAITIFFIIFFFIFGIPDTDSARIGYIIEGSPAEAIGIQVGDTITAIDGISVDKWEEVLTIISAKPNTNIILAIEREGTFKELNVISGTAPDSPRGMIGIGPIIQKYRLLPSLKASVERFGAVIASVSQVVTGQAPLDIAGPVGIVFVIGEVAQTGFVNLMMLTALISISLGIVNLLPIPALDGGRLLLLLVEVLRGRRIDPEKEGLIHLIGFALMILCILFITYQDLLRWDVLPGN